MISSFNTEREVAQLKIAQEYHESQIERIEERIEALEFLENLRQADRRLSLVTGGTGVGTTTFGVTLAEQDNRPIISNLESLEDAYYANSWEQVESILNEHPDQSYTLLIDEFAYESDREYFGFLTQMIKQGHHAILTTYCREDLHYWFRELADAEYHLPERGTVEYTTSGSGGVECTASVGLSRRSFDSMEAPHFDFRKPVKEQTEPVEDRELFDPDDWPPQFHIDNLEMQLDFNLGQVYGFLDLDKQSQADLAKLAVEYELDKESVQNILNICRELGSLDGDRHTQSARAGDEARDSDV